MSNLVDIKQVIPNVLLDIRYATVNNFLNEPVYTQPKCYLHRDVAERLSKVQLQFAKMKYGIKVFDGYRPLSVQQRMWDKIQDERYVSNPAVNKGRHTRGTAVDLTLVDEEGKELEMPTEFDDFTEKAHSDCKEVSLTAIKNRTLLAEVMQAHGFFQLPTEWWHFDFQGWNDDNKYPPLDLSFEQLEKSH